MYHNFIGIDISKADFVVAQHEQNAVHTFNNSAEGYTAFCETYRSALPQSLVVLETTGGYEMGLVRHLIAEGVNLHRANTRQVKYFIRSLGKKAKTDTIDAHGLARYGYERQNRLELFILKSCEQTQLQQFIERRQDLKKMLVQEKNRKQGPTQEARILSSCETIIKSIEDELKALNLEIQSLIDQDPIQKEKQKVLQEVDGIGEAISSALLALLPELGTVNRGQIASLTGLAPHPYESGTKIGYRKTSGGRQEVKCILFMSAMTASRSKGRLGEFYRGLIARGKKKMVALTALMRKIVVIANAKLACWYKAQDILHPV